MPPQNRPQREGVAFACPVSTHRGTCALQDVAARMSSGSVEAVGTAVVVHGTVSERDLANVRDSHPERHVTLDGDVLVLWPGDRPNN